MLPLVNADTNYTVEEMQKEVHLSLKPMGKEYQDKVQEMFDNR
jgi:oligoendopeptidase F